ncbi:MAG TPA: TetR/AcrR family transcriptional regulator [Burkholderiaceae bacterium]|nr:TetR/AcrR family transcriptional regulator [Burkholderiaceae bacterium]
MREALIEAAAAEFFETGYHTASTNRIAARAGLSSGVFYNYFRDKVEVLLAVYEHWVDEEWALIRADIADGSRSFEQRIEALVPKLLQHHAKWHRLRHALLVLTPTEPRVAASRTTSRRRQVAEVIRLLGRRPTRRLRVQVAVKLLAFEAVADSLVTGEAERLGLAPDDLAAHLAELLLPLIRP